MDHHIVQHSGRGKNKAIIKGESSSGGAASPTAFLIAYGDFGIVSAGECVVIGDAIGKYISRHISVSFFQYCKPLLFSGGQVVCHVGLPFCIIKVFFQQLVMVGCRNVEKPVF